MNGRAKAIRIAINAGNTALARRDPQTGALEGIAITLGRRLAAHVGSAPEFLVHDAANQILETSADDAWDFAFLAVDPSRAGQIAFSVPYMTTEATFAVWRSGGPRSIADIDRPTRRIAATRNAAYARVLSRQIVHATIVELATAAAAVDLFLRERLDAVAGIRTALDGLARRDPQVMVLPGGFATIEQAIAVPRGREQDLAMLDGFVRAWLAG